MIGIILGNTGSPSSPDPKDVDAYLRQFLMDKRIRPLPKPFWKYLLNCHILPKRKHSSAKRYQSIWTEKGSPLTVNQQRLAEKIQSLFEADKVQVRSAMSYGSPSITDALQELHDKGAARIVFLPMYPQSAFSSTMATVDAFIRAQDAIGWHPETRIIDNYHDDPGYIAAIARSIRGVGFDAPAGDRLILSFHAIPLKDEAAGDTYRTQIAESVQLIANELKIESSTITVSFQSVFGHDASKWTSPLSRDVLQDWRDDDCRVVFACPGFSVDCLETLYDIPHEMVSALEGDEAVPIATHEDGSVQSAHSSTGRFVWVPTLNTSDEHASLIKSILDKSIAEI